MCPANTDSLAPLQENDAVATVARVIYADRRFSEAPILADALEDAGCTNTAILDHLRGPGPMSADVTSLTSSWACLDLQADLAAHATPMQGTTVRGMPVLSLPGTAFADRRICIQRVCVRLQSNPSWRHSGRALTSPSTRSVCARAMQSIHAVLTQRRFSCGHFRRRWRGIECRFCQRTSSRFSTRCTSATVITTAWATCLR